MPWSRWMWKIFLENIFASEIGFDSPSLKKFGMMNVSPWLNPQDALQHLRRNICADSNGIVTECFVHWSLESHDHLLPLFIVWYWWTVTLRKDGSKQLFQWTNPGHWRPLANLSITYKNLTRMVFFFPRSFFLQSLGFGLLYWSVSRQRNDCFTGQSPGNEGGGVANGQWSMPVRHKASPFWAQAVKRNMYIGFAWNFKLLSHLAKSVEVFKKCIPVMMVFRFLYPWSQTFVSTKSLELIVPSVRSPSQGSVSDRWIPSKNSSHQAMFR